MAYKEKFPTTSVNDTSIGTVAWVSPEYLLDPEEDGTTSSVVLNNSSSNWLKVTNFGFNIPEGAIINGIKCEYLVGFSGSWAGSRISRIVKNGTIGSTAPTPGFIVSGLPSGAWSASGSETHLWGETWTASDINNSGFGTAIRFVNTNTSNVTFWADTIKITVYYEYGDIEIQSTAVSLSLKNINIPKQFSPVGILKSGYLLHTESVNITRQIKSTTNKKPITSTVTFKKIEDKDFNLLNIYRYLDLMFKNLQAKIGITIYQDKSDIRSSQTKQFYIGLGTEDELATIGEVDYGENLVADGFGQSPESAPFIKRRISFLSKAQSLTISLTNSGLSDSFTICQFSLTGMKQEKKTFDPAAVISIK